MTLTNWVKNPEGINEISLSRSINLLLINRSTYIACCSIILNSKHFFSNHGRCYVQLIFVVDYLKNPHNTYQKMEYKLVRNFK